MFLPALHLLIRFVALEVLSTMLSPRIPAHLLLTFDGVVVHLGARWP
jgi:hypothetical protein